MCRAVCTAAPTAAAHMPPAAVSLLADAAVAPATSAAPTQHGHLWLLLRAQLHQVAAFGQLQLGQHVQAAVHAQEAARLACAVHAYCVASCAGVTSVSEA